MKTHREFELLVKDYLHRHPDIDHEWRRTSDLASGGHTDLVCAPDSEQEVVARLQPDLIAVSDKDGNINFEDSGRGLSRQKLATKALAHLIRLLQKMGDGRDSEGS